MKIAIGTDHRGFEHKEHLKSSQVLISKNIVWFDKGSYAYDPHDDYPPYAVAVCSALQHKEADLGILLCGTGAGMSIVANRYQGIYAALVWNPELARLSKEHDNANVLVLPADYCTVKQAEDMVIAWLDGAFLHGRHQRRIEEIDAMGGL